MPILLQDMIFKTMDFPISQKSSFYSRLYFKKGGYKQILGIEGNSSIATDMSVWDGVSATILSILKMVEVI